MDIKMLELLNTQTRASIYHRQYGSAAKWIKHEAFNMLSYPERSWILQEADSSLASQL